MPGEVHFWGREDYDRTKAAFHEWLRQNGLQQCAPQFNRFVVGAGYNDLDYLMELSEAELKEHLAGGLLPWWSPLAVVGTFLLVVLWLVLRVQRHHPTDLEAWEDPDQGISDQIGDL